MRKNPVPSWVLYILTGERRHTDKPVEPLLRRLSGRVPDAWLPARRGEVLEDQLGCGLFGCVLRTNDPGIVLKLSADQAEAVFVAWLISLGKQAPLDGIVRYLAILDTGETHGIPYYDEKARERAKRDQFASPVEPIGYTQYPVRLIWREAAIHVGINDMKTRPPEPKAPDGSGPTGLHAMVLKKEWKEHQEGWGNHAETFEEFLASRTSWHQKRQAAHEVALERWRTTRWFSRDEIHVANQLWSKGVSLYYYAAKALVRIHRAAETGADVSERDLDRAEGAVASSVDVIEGVEGGRWIARTLRELLDRRVVLRDIHPSNLGIVVRDGQERWVVTDPSQAEFLDGAPTVTIPVV